ncbi:hypothetical protein H257_14605 [Aphanomyces astaci]|uniref:Uncharacterized protein n=1 Tax=Aphanomyces astaci TaxID=112090 RepID=W4FSF8_APHAT|nr:hypothetical protein H257_14605 [Aphanomyces astaci]ETV69779.1 hypothetical protein H257_14605 [Aphanomyces astaci]|eukprot:XP_009840793.1 hypothetical protein H257_14605 [Aphanomyces astaci]
MASALIALDRFSLHPSMIEATLFLKCNRSYWDVLTVHETLEYFHASHLRTAAPVVTSASSIRSPDATSAPPSTSILQQLTAKLRGDPV